MYSDMKDNLVNNNNKEFKFLVIVFIIVFQG